MLQRLPQTTIKRRNQNLALCATEFVAFSISIRNFHNRIAHRNAPDYNPHVIQMQEDDSCANCTHLEDTPD